MMYLMPRLPSVAGDVLLAEFLTRGAEQYVFDWRQLPDRVRYAATGGPRLDSRHLEQFREGLLGIAIRYGFPSSKAASSQAVFDVEIAKYLSEIHYLGFGESLRDDVWSFVGIILAPDIVRWRFGSSAERYHGGVRNTFQRLWLRAKLFDRGPESQDRWLLLESLTEDAMVQITERSSIASDPILARAIAEAWVRCAARSTSKKMEPIMRRAILIIRVENEIRCFSRLSQSEIESELDAIFSKAESSAPEN